MYEFHYGRVKRKYNAKVLFEDTVIDTVLVEDTLIVLKKAFLN